MGGWGALAVDQGHQFVVQSRQEFRWQGSPLAAGFITSLKLGEGWWFQKFRHIIATTLQFLMHGLFIGRVFESLDSEELSFLTKCLTYFPNTLEFLMNPIFLFLCSAVFAKKFEVW